MDEIPQDSITAFCQAVVESGYICPECGQTVDVHKIRFHLPCIKEWEASVQAIVDAVNKRVEELKAEDNG